MLYIRDNAYSWKPAGKVNVEKCLKKNNFTLECKPHVIDKVDIFGVPRIWRKTDPEVMNSQLFGFDHKINQLLIDIDAFSGGNLRKIKNLIRKNR